MKTRLIDGGVYRETLRFLRVPAVVMLVIATVFDLFFQIVSTVLDFTDFYSMHPSLYAIPFICPYLLTLIAFRFQAKRCDSDFYHSLPFTRTTLSASMLAAIGTWLAVITVGSSILVAASALSLTAVSIPNILLTIAACFIASLLVMAVTFLSTVLCGNLISMAATVPLLLFGPLYMQSTLYSMVQDNTHLLPSLYYTVLDPSHQSLLYNGYKHPSAWILTVLLTAALLVLGLWIARHRPSETAQNAAVHPIVQTMFRLLIGLLCCLPAMHDFFSPEPDVILICSGCLTALVVYFLYELITTRKAKNLLTAVPGLAALALLNVLCVLGVDAAVSSVNSYMPTPEKVDSISLTAHITQQEMVYQTDFYEEADYLTDPHIYYKLKYPEIEGRALFDNDNYSWMGTDENYYTWRDLYGDSTADQTKVKDPACIKAACDAFAQSVKDVENDREAYETVFENALGKEWAVYEVCITFHEGLLSHSRILFLTESEYVALLNAINDVKPLPAFTFNYKAIQ